MARPVSRPTHKEGTHFSVLGVPVQPGLDVRGPFLRPHRLAENERTGTRVELLEPVSLGDIVCIQCVCECMYVHVHVHVRVCVCMLHGWTPTGKTSKQARVVFRVEKIRNKAAKKYRYKRKLETKLGW